MTDLDTRLDHLRQTAVPAGPDAAEVRTRAARRKARRHRRYALGALPVIALVVIAAAVATTGDDGPQSVITGSDPAPTEAPASTAAEHTTVTTASRSLGDVPGLAVRVSPAADLTDGQIVRVTVEGYEQLNDPVITLCAGDVRAESAQSRCDLTPLEGAGSSPGGSTVLADQEVVVRRIIAVSPTSSTTTPTTSEDGLTPYGPRAYDCSTEPEGCVLVVGEYTSPTRGSAVPVTFVPSIDGAPAMTATPAVGVRDGEEVQVQATGLRPNTTYGVTQCDSSADGGCNDINWPGAKTGPDGRLDLAHPVRAAIYGWRGRTDCTRTACHLAVRTEGGETISVASIEFEPGVEAPVPRLTISPDGPYDRKQQVTVTGTGFPPGYEYASDLGVCPVGKDTAIEERCTYPLAFAPEVFVAADGTFTTTMPVSPSHWSGEAGNQLGWVIPHGPTIAPVPIAFR